jgi:hypothetical protein
MPATSSVLPEREVLEELEVTAMIKQMQKSGHLMNHLVSQHFEGARQAQ